MAGKLHLMKNKEKKTYNLGAGLQPSPPTL
jgi:hypothetical protein